MKRLRSAAVLTLAIWKLSQVGVVQAKRAPGGG